MFAMESNCPNKNHTTTKIVSKTTTILIYITMRSARRNASICHKFHEYPNFCINFVLSTYGAAHEKLFTRKQSLLPIHTKISFHHQFRFASANQQLITQRKRIVHTFIWFVLVHGSNQCTQHWITGWQKYCKLFRIFLLRPWAGEYFALRSQNNDSAIRFFPTEWQLRTALALDKKKILFFLSMCVSSYAFASDSE